MHCPFCNTEDTKVIDSRLVNDGQKIRRRRECTNCQERFTTYEFAEISLPRLIKKDGNFEQFDETKLRSGIMRAIEKRPINIETVDKVIAEIIQSLRNSGEREISTQKLGEITMKKLKDLDEVAYVRFASVYRRFEDIADFHEEIVKLSKVTEDNVNE